MLSRLMSQYSIITFILILFATDLGNTCVEEDPCMNGATCTDSGYFSYACNCSAGYSGTNCEIGELMVFLYMILPPPPPPHTHSKQIGLNHFMSFFSMSNPPFVLCQRPFDTDNVLNSVRLDSLISFID